MEKCPTEIHSRIVSFACTDDGTTGRSLSLVSKYFHQVALPYEWQSLALSGCKHAMQFALHLSRSKPKGPIYHLFLSDRRCTSFSDSAESEASQSTLPSRMTLRDALEGILTYAAPTLHTLSLFSVATFLGGAATIAHVLSFSYPHITELTIRGRCTPVQLASMSESLTTYICEMPSLRRLHLALPCHGFAYGNLQRTRDLVRTLSSNITHLRITMLDMWGSKRVAEVLHAELAESGIVSSVLDLPPLQCDVPLVATAQDVTWDRLVPDELTLFVIQPSPTMSFYCSCCMDFRGDVDVVRIFQRMSEEADGRRFLYLGGKLGLPNDSLEAAMGYGFSEAKLDWLDRMEECPGCWAKREEPVPDDEVHDRVPYGTSADSPKDALKTGTSKVRSMARKLKTLMLKGAR